MSAPRETVWEFGEHSRGKHLVLRTYLKAWLPILGQTQGRIIQISITYVAGRSEPSPGLDPVSQRFYEFWNRPPLRFNPPDDTGDFRRRPAQSLCQVR